VITPLEGLQRIAPGLELRYSPGHNLAKAAALARGAKLAIVVVGYTQADEGEYLTAVPFVMRGKGNDRLSLLLSLHDEALILATVAANPRTLVVLQGGSAIVMEAWREQVPAILVQWYAGMEGGNALANLLTGEANPSGKLPSVFPKSAEQLPFFDREVEAIEYGAYHGYRLMDKAGEEPAFAFGYGLSYTTFKIDRLRIESEKVEAGGTIRACVEVRNTGARAGAEVVQLYAGCTDSVYDRPVKELKGFQKVALQPGETRQVEFELPASRLAVWDGGWVVERGPYRLWVGSSSREEDLVEGSVEITT
jgi:beta-glucosidase